MENVDGIDALEKESVEGAFSEDLLGPDICTVITSWNEWLYQVYGYRREKFLILLKNTLHPDEIFLTGIESREREMKRILTDDEKTREQIKKEYRKNFFDLTFEYFMLQGKLQVIEDDLYGWID